MFPGLSMPRSGPNVARHRDDRGGQNALKRRLLAGGAALRGGASSASGNVAKLLGWAGYDFAIHPPLKCEGVLGSATACT